MRNVQARYHLAQSFLGGRDRSLMTKSMAEYLDQNKTRQISVTTRLPLDEDPPHIYSSDMIDGKAVHERGWHSSHYEEHATCTAELGPHKPAHPP